MTLVSEELAGASLLFKSSTIKGLEVIDDAPYAASETTFYFRRIVCWAISYNVRKTILSDVMVVI